jgi:hypothetical protein
MATTIKKKFDDNIDLIVSDGEEKSEDEDDFFDHLDKDLTEEGSPLKLLKSVSSTAEKKSQKAAEKPKKQRIKFKDHHTETFVNDLQQ